VATDPSNWAGDRSRIFERDGYTCRHCGRGDETASGNGVRVVAPGPVPETGAVHESALVTVCDDCFSTLQEPSPPPTASQDTLFEAMKRVTALQSDSISTVADFAGLATTMPSTLEAGDEPDYVEARQNALLEFAIVDATLASLEEATETGADLERLTNRDDADLAGALEAFCETARTLQAQLHDVVGHSEVVAVGLGRCHGCFEPVDRSGEETCDTCGLERRDGGEWRREDGTVRFEDLYSAINTTLQASSRTTTTLTVRTQTVATRLLGQST